MLSAVKPVTSSSKVMVMEISLSLLLVVGMSVTTMVALGGLLSMLYVTRFTFPAARFARDMGDAGHVDADLQVLHFGVGRQVGRRPQVYLPRPAAVGGAQVL